MKTLTITFLLTLSLTLQNNATIDERQSTIAFTFLNDEVTGTIGDIQSQSTIDLHNLEDSTIKGSVAVTTLKTGNFLRDGHLMWEKYFNRREHPSLYFVSTSIDQQQLNTYHIKGVLTIKGTQKEVTFQAVKKDQEIHLSGRIYTSDWGIWVKNKRENNAVDVQMSMLLK